MAQLFSLGHIRAMTKTEQLIDLKFGEIRQRYTGKMPFGVLHDLGALHDDLSSDDRQIFWQALDARRADEFWSWYVSEFSRSHQRI